MTTPLLFLLIFLFVFFEAPTPHLLRSRDPPVFLCVLAFLVLPYCPPPSSRRREGQTPGGSGESEAGVGRARLPAEPARTWPELGAAVRPAPALPAADTRGRSADGRL